VFRMVLDKFFGGNRDKRTIDLVKSNG